MTPCKNSNRRYVAIIDDDESVCRSLGRLLHLAGFQPIAFTSAEEFIADSFRTHFSCLLVDIQLGGMSGTVLHRQLVAEGCGVPVIYITAHDDPSAKAAALELDCAGFFQKTDAGADVIAAINRVTSEPDATIADRSQDRGG